MKNETNMRDLIDTLLARSNGMKEAATACTLEVDRLMLRVRAYEVRRCARMIETAMNVDECRPSEAAPVRGAHE